MCQVAFIKSGCKNLSHPISSSLCHPAIRTSRGRVHAPPLEPGLSDSLVSVRVQLESNDTEWLPRLDKKKSHSSLCGPYGVHMLSDYRVREAT